MNETAGRFMNWIFVSTINFCSVPTVAGSLVQRQAAADACRCALLKALPQRTADFSREMRFREVQSIPEVGIR